MAARFVQASPGERLPARAAEINVAKSTGIFQRGAYTIRRRNRFWEVLDPSGTLVCLTVYKRGAEEVVRRLGA